MNNQVNTPSIATNDIIMIVTGEDLKNLGYYIAEDDLEDKFNLIITTAKPKQLNRSISVVKYTYKKIIN